MRSARVAAIAVLLCTWLVAAASASGAATRTPVGNDIAWPQCGKAYPAGQAFGIVDVNHGRANDTNSCFADELAWAKNSSGAISSQPRAQLYVNTGNPSGAGPVWWPTTDCFVRVNDTTDASTDSTAANATCVSMPPDLGDCTSNGTDAACSYVYGYAKAFDDWNYRAMASAGSPIVWLDVETTNSWESGAAGQASNRADLRGMIAYFDFVVPAVGVYSTALQWNQIAGDTSSDSTFNDLPNWVAGASSATASKYCSKRFTGPAAPVLLTQYVSGRFDYDHSCTS